MVERQLTPTLPCLQRIAKRAMGDKSRPLPKALFWDLLGLQKIWCAQHRRFASTVPKWFWHWTGAIFEGTFRGRWQECDTRKLTHAKIFPLCVSYYISWALGDVVRHCLHDSRTPGKGIVHKVIGAVRRKFVWKRRRDRCWLGRRAWTMGSLPSVGVSADDVSGAGLPHLVWHAPCGAPKGTLLESRSKSVYVNLDHLKCLFLSLDLDAPKILKISDHRATTWNLFFFLISAVVIVIVDCCSENWGREEDYFQTSENLLGGFQIGVSAVSSQHTVILASSS